MIEVIALARPFPHTGKDRIAAMLLGNVADEFHNDHGLAHAGAAEEADFAALNEGTDEVDDLDSGLEDLHLSGLVLEFRSRAMDGIGLFGLDGRQTVDGLACDADHAAQSFRSDGYGNRRASIDDREAAGQTVRGGHGHGTDARGVEVLLDLEDELTAIRRFYRQGVQDGRQFADELGVDDWADD